MNINFERLENGNVVATFGSDPTTYTSMPNIDKNAATNKIYLRFPNRIDDFSIDGTADTITVDGGGTISGLNNMTEALQEDVFYENAGSGGSDVLQRTVTNITHEQLTSRVEEDAVAATGELTMDDQPEEGDTITIGGTEFTFTASPSFGQDIEIGATLADTKANTVAKINDLSQTLISDFSGDVATLTARAPGAAGNDIATTSTSSNATFGAATLTGGADAVYADPIVLVPVPEGKVAWHVILLVQKKFLAEYANVNGESFNIFREGTPQDRIALADGSIDFENTDEENIEIIISSSALGASTGLDKSLLFGSLAPSNVTGGDAANQFRITATYTLSDRLT